VKILIISDVHGNGEAVRALPDGFDELWVLGDLVNYGPEPKEVVDLVRAKASVVVRGNHDHSIGYDEDPRCTPRYHDMAEATRRFSASAVTEDQKKFLRDLPLKAEIKRRDARFYLTHARPSDRLYGYCPQDSDEWIKEVESVRADVVLVGHTHTPFVRKIGNQLLVNPGSLGQPKTGKPDACYAVWNDGTFELKSFSYPVNRTIAKLQSLSFPPEIEKDLITVLQTGSV
jgi:putative phosphoesterase